METGVQKRNIVVIFVCLTVLGFLICIASLGSVSAEPAGPNFYYYSSRRKYALILSKEKLAVRFNEGLTIEERKAVVESEPDLGLFYQRGESPTLRLTVGSPGPSRIRPALPISVCLPACSKRT